MLHGVFPRMQRSPPCPGAYFDGPILPSRWQTTQFIGRSISFTWTSSSSLSYSLLRRWMATSIVGCSRAALGVADGGSRVPIPDLLLNTLQHLSRQLHLRPRPRRFHQGGCATMKRAHAQSATRSSRWSIDGIIVCCGKLVCASCAPKRKLAEDGGAMRERRCDDCAMDSK